MRFFSGICFWFLFVLAILSPPVVATAQFKGQTPTGKEPFLLIADEVVYDKELETVTARGNVEIGSEGRVLKADVVNYNQRDGLVSATGNVSLTEPTGEVVFAEYVQLDEKLTTGFIESIRILLTDDSRFAANGARRYADERTEMAKAVYSPCKPCAEDPDRALIWQVKAVKVIHRQTTREIEYRDATLEVFGIPVLYLPFFRHPDPTVERASGFLAPKFGNDSNLGVNVQVPYYFDIAPDRDATFAPIMTQREGLVLTGEYRQLTNRGRYQAEGSITYTDRRDDTGAKIGGKEFRGHINGWGRFSLGDDWRWGWDASRASDDTYLKRYNISNADTLTSKAFVHQVKGTRFLSGSAYAFQGLKETDDPALTPYVLPLLEYSYLSDPIGNWGRFDLNANTVSLYRSGGADTRRFSVGGGWTSPHVGPFGDLYTFIARLRGDVYWSNQVEDTSNPAIGTENAVEARLIPTLALDWRLPLVRQSGSWQQIIEPIIQAVYAPNGLNSGTIPNEDSISFEFDNTNLFSLNRFPGHDLVESGTRINIGLKGSIYADNGGTASFTIGQVYRLEDDSTFPTNTGLDKNSSDIVTELAVSPAHWLDLVHRTRFDPKNLTLDRHELYMTAGPPAYRFTVSYLRLDEDDPVRDIEPREEIYAAARIKLDDNWTFSAHGRRDLIGSGRTIKTGAGLHYEDECIMIEVTVDRDNTRDRDAKPSTSVNFRIVLQHLG